MSTQYCTLQSVKTALLNSRSLIANQSHLRVAGFSRPEMGTGSHKLIAINSDECSGTGEGRLADGVLIGLPIAPMCTRSMVLVELSIEGGQQLASSMLFTGQ